MIKKQEKRVLSTRHSVIAVGRRLNKMGRKLAQRRLKSLRRLFARSAKILWPMLKNADAYFPFFHFYYIFTLARAARKFFYGSIAFDAKKWPMLKNSATLIQFRPRREVADAYLRRRQFPTGE